MSITTNFLTSSGTDIGLLFIPIINFSDVSITPFLI